MLLRLTSCFNSPVSFLNSPEALNALKAKLPTYLVKAAGTIEWWKMNTIAPPNWSAAARKALLLQPSSAASERVFSLLKNSFNEQDNSLQGYIQFSLMMQCLYIWPYNIFIALVNPMRLLCQWDYKL